MERQRVNAPSGGSSRCKGQGADRVWHVQGREGGPASLAWREVNGSEDRWNQLR